MQRRQIPALTVNVFLLSVHFVQDMYDKQRGKKRGLGSDADSDGGQIGFGSGRPAKKQLMSDEQVGCLLYYHSSVAHLQVVIKLLLSWMTPAEQHVWPCLGCLRGVCDKHIK